MAQCLVSSCVYPHYQCHVGSASPFACPLTPDEEADPLKRRNHKRRGFSPLLLHHSPIAFPLSASRRPPKESTTTSSSKANHFIFWSSTLSLTTMRSVAALMGVTDPFDPDHRYVTSWLLRPAHLATIRLLLSLYAFVTMFTTLGLEGYPSDAQSVSYFTDLTYWGLAFYMLTSGFHTAMYVRNKGQSFPLQRWGKVAQGAHVCFYAACVVFPPIVSITFWAILFKGSFPSRFEWWSNISMHALNSGYMLFEVVVTSTPVLGLLTLPVLVVILCLYLGLAYLTFDTQGFYTYDFLDPAEGAGKRAAYIVGILVASVVIWGVVRGLIWLRLKATKGRGKGVWGERREAVELEKQDEAASC